MREKLIYILIGFLFSYSPYLKAQGIKSAPIDLQFDKLNAYHNVTLTPLGDNLNVGMRNLTGAFSEIRNIYAFGTSALDSFRRAGIAYGLNSEQEGPLISENRVKVGFWKKLKFTKKYQLVTGAYLGIINSSIKSTNSTPSSNAWNPDLNIGLTLYSSGLTFSGSINQISNSSIQLLSQLSTFKRYATILCSQKLTINFDWTLNIYEHLVFFKDINDIYEVKGNFVLKKKHEAGLSFGNRGVFFSLGTVLLKTSSYTSNITIAYHSPVYSTLPNNFQSIQIHFSLKK